MGSSAEVSTVTRANSVSITGFLSNMHKIKKKAYRFNLEKQNDKTYNSRIKINKKTLPEGEFTLCLEFFYPPSVSNWGVSGVSTSQNVNQYVTKRFRDHAPEYTRSIRLSTPISFNQTLTST